jgi:TonB family protein
VLTAGEKIYKEKEVDKTIRLGMRVGANYSENGRRQHATGPVILKCVFAANGEVTNIKVIKGMPWGLTEKAIEAAKKVRFIPARKDGQFVSVRMEITYNFGLYDF